MTRMIAFFIAILVAVVSAEPLQSHVKSATDSTAHVSIFNARNKIFCHAELIQEKRLVGQFMNCTRQGTQADCQFSGLHPNTKYNVATKCCNDNNAQCDDGEVSFTTKGFLSVTLSNRDDNSITIRGSNKDSGKRCFARISEPSSARRSRSRCSGAECKFTGLKPSTAYTMTLSCCVTREECVYGDIQTATTGELQAEVTGAYGNLVNIKVPGLYPAEQCSATVISPATLKYLSVGCINLGNMADCVLSPLPEKTSMDIEVECCSCGTCKSKTVKATTGAILEIKLVPVGETDINMWAYHSNPNKKCKASILFPPKADYEEVTCYQHYSVRICKFKNLEKQVEYTFGVKCCHGDECNSGSASGSLEGSNDKRPYVKEVTAKVVSVNSAEVSWDVSGRAKLCYATAKSIGKLPKKTCKAKPEKGGCTIHDLKKLKQYTIYVECCVAYNVCAFGEDRPRIRMDMQKD